MGLKAVMGGIAVPMAILTETLLSSPSKASQENVR